MTTGFEPFGPDTLEQGPEAYVKMGRQNPIFRHRDGNYEFYITSNPTRIREMLQDHQAWPVRFGTGPNDMREFGNSGVLTDPPDHQPYRAIVQRALSPAKLKELAIVIDQLTTQLIDKMIAIPEGKGDFFQLFAKPLPVSRTRAS